VVARHIAARHGFQFIVGKGYLFSSLFQFLLREIKPRFTDNLYSSAGIGLRGSVPGMHTVASTGVVPFHRKTNLTDEYKTYIYASLSVDF